jgi:PAS domain S-box-containing protein
MNHLALEQARSEALRNGVMLRETESQLRGIIEHATEGLWFLDLEGRIVFANLALCSLLDASVIGLVGRPAADLCLVHDRQRRPFGVLSGLDGTSHRFEARLRRRDGRLVEVHGSTCPIRDYAGHVTGALGLFTAVTDQVAPPWVDKPRRESDSIPVDLASLEKAMTNGSYRILVVDDSADGRESLAELLRLAGHEVAEAADGPAAIETAGLFRPHVVLLDIGLPGMDGFEVATRLRQMPELVDSVLIALTGYGQPEIVSRSHRAGFNYHIVKPMHPDALKPLLPRLG